MPREIRLVHPDWEHPKDAEGNWIPLHERRAEDATGDCMPEWTAEEASWVQFYESTSEGTPLSLPLPSVEALARWCWEHRDQAGLPKEESPAKLLNYLTHEWLRARERATRAHETPLDREIREAWEESGFGYDAGPRAAFNTGYGMALARLREGSRADIETLTEDERSVLTQFLGMSHADSGVVFANADVVQKALRIIDTQAARIRSLEILGNHDAEVIVSTAEQGAARIAELEQRLAKSRQRIAELEAQVLSSDTVAKAEYQQMVQQRDTMRKELSRARALLDDALGWLRVDDRAAAGDWPELGALILRIEALPPFRVE